MLDRFPYGALYRILEQGSPGDVAGTGSDDSEEKEMSEQQYVNYYRCPYDGTEWADVWSCCCNDMCPKCGTKDIEPYKSEEVVHTHSVERKPTKGLKRQVKKARRTR
jgi:hypothetical protein